jgi:translation initiation factor IF-3
MDYGKYVFEQSKKEKEARKNQHVVSLKEIRLTLVIGEHDLNTKLNNAIRILKDGNKLKVTVRFRSRELHNAATGILLLNRFAEACSAYSVVEKPPKLEGRNMIMFLAAKAPEK